MIHSGETWIKNHSKSQFISDPIPTGLVGRWQLIGTQFVFEFTNENTHSNYYSINDTDYKISSDGSTLTWSGYDYSRKYNTSISLPGVWERYWTDDKVYEELNFHEDGTYTTHWRPWNEDYFGTYLENIPTIGKLRLRELNSVVTIAGSNITFNPFYMPTRTGVYLLEEDNLSIVFPDGKASYKRVI